MYPRGIEYSSPCVADPSSCSHITTGTLNVETLAWYNSAAIPDGVKVVQASTTPGSVSVENVLLCQSTLLKTRKVVLTDETGVPTDVYFKIPSINRAISFGSQWITQVHDSVISALGLEQPNVSDDTWSERNLLITTQGKASFLRQYAAFVTKIDLYEGGVIEDNEQDIADVLTVMSGSDKVRSDMMSAAEKFIADSAIGVIGLPVYACPACGKTPDLGGNHILALDPVRLFFKYLVIRVDQINQRSML
jgi:rubrerythrin